MQVESLEGKKTNEEYICPKQSANVLFNFMKKIDYLKNILENKAIIPRYNEENIQYLKIKGLERIAFPMSCFCDIQLNKLKYHIYKENGQGYKYGAYGIGVNKKWCIEKGVQPINYINENSSMVKDFSYIFNKALEKNKDKHKHLEVVKEYNNYLLTSLLYMKPIWGTMPVDGKNENRNFHDEREWRYIPNINNVKTELPQVIHNEEFLTQASYNSHSSGIRYCQDLWLKFEYKDIKYIVVEDCNGRKDIIDFIMKKENIDQDEKRILISKILVFNELKEDW